VNGNHYYSVTVTDANGCQGSVSWVGAVGVTELPGTDMYIYPNPATETISIESPVAVKAVITGMDGRIIMERTNATSMDISTLPNGFYQVSLYDDKGQKLLTQKLVKQ
jgi:hypothetical protein